MRERKFYINKTDGLCLLPTVEITKTGSRFFVSFIFIVWCITYRVDRGAVFKASKH